MSARTMLLEARGIGRRRPDGRAWMLRDVSVEVAAGSRLAVVGASGSGKTLLLRALALLDPLDAGEVRWRGEEVAAEQVPEYRRQVMYLHQKPVMFAGSVEENLRAPFALRVQREGKFDRQWIVEQLRQLGRDASFLDKPAGELSGGEGQLVALLRAVQLGPAVLLLDEPTASLDAEAAEAVEQFVGRWWEEQAERRAMVWVTHDASQARRVAVESWRLAGGTWENDLSTRS